jgi:DNA-binding CsgD family transcriptional regulator
LNRQGLTLSRLISTLLPPKPLELPDPRLVQTKPVIPKATISKWQRIVDITARIVEVPSSLVMKTDPPDHAVLVSSNTAGNPYRVGMSFELNSKLYCYSVLSRCDELIVRNANVEAEWRDNQDLEHGMSFYIGYPITWPDGALFGTICVLDRRENQKAILHRDLLMEFCRLIEGDLALIAEGAQRERLERALQDHLAELESRVAERTRELTRANDELREEISSRRAAEDALRQRERQLEEANTALRVLLAQVETSRLAFEEQIVRQINGLVLPHLAKLRQHTGRSEPGRAYLDLVENNLNGITSSFANRLVTVFQRLTPAEAEIAQMIMAGKTTKDIAMALSREPSTIDFHRNNIRRKLGLEDRRRTLRSHLLSLH